MRICFCDDEPAMRQLLEQMVRRWAQQTGTACELSCCASAEQMLFENQENFAFDLILLDIQMERMDGIQLAKTIRQRDQRVLIAFLTAVREHVFEGYEVQAVRYLLKPLQEEKLFELLQLAADRAREQRPYLILGPEGERRKVYLDALLSVEAQGESWSRRARWGRCFSGWTAALCRPTAALWSTCSMWCASPAPTARWITGRRCRSPAAPTRASTRRSSGFTGRGFCDGALTLGRRMFGCGIG